ncbi:MAG: hypothetical protein A2Z29_02595 [Chloroflexi bacterium RBG_16_56_11]|nr:MAG: hypothetical protein A2Z29_02595 [Chloroflexi bacterium RBG_16_56_11]
MKMIDLTKKRCIKYDRRSRRWSIDTDKLNLDKEFRFHIGQARFLESPKTLVILKHSDDELWLSAIAIDNIDFCVVFAKDPGNGTNYLLLDKRGVEDSGTVTEPPVAGFNASTNHGRAPLIVRFSDKSSGEITGWLWDFGDGTTSKLQNPYHIYLKPGTYSVTLTVSGPGGYDTLIINNCIEVEQFRFRWWK